MKSQFSLAVVGGTFDHFHKGHEHLLNAVFYQSENVIIGISTEKLYKSKLFTQTIESFETREKSIKDYLKLHDLEANTSIIPIDDIYGTTLINKNIEVIFVTEDNKNAAYIINEERKVIGFPQLLIITIPFTKAIDGQTISSEQIRSGLMNRNGFTYLSLFQKRSLSLPEKLRAKLRKPIGIIAKDIHEQIPNIRKATMIISVGDIVTFSLVDSGMQPDISIVDFKTRRHGLKENERALLESITSSNFTSFNSAGQIEPLASRAVYNAFGEFSKTERKQVITINGEEDLLALPAILFAPLGSIVVYGQYDEGAVFVEVTEEKKEEILDLINQFE